MVLSCTWYFQKVEHKNDLLQPKRKNISQFPVQANLKGKEK